MSGHCAPRNTWLLAIPVDDPPDIGDVAELAAHVPRRESLDFRQVVAPLPRAHNHIGCSGFLGKENNVAHVLPQATVATSVLAGIPATKAIRAGQLVPAGARLQDVCGSIDEHDHGATTTKRLNYGHDILLPQYPRRGWRYRRLN